jgi:hypothetical protein
MHLRTRLALSAALALAALSCRCDKPYSAEKLSKDADALFSRAEQPGPGGSLVVDLEQWRVLGFLRASEGQAASAVVDTLMFLLPGVAAEMKDDGSGPLVARTTVLVGLLREWAPWPQVLRVGLLVPSPSPDQALPDMLGAITLAAATKGGLEQNRELLQGLAALDRASGSPVFTLDGDLLCTTAPVIGLPVCLRAGDGFLAIAGPDGARSPLPGEGSPRPAAPAPSLVRLRAEVPLLGKASLTVSGSDAVRIAAAVEVSDPAAAARLETTAKEYLARLDENRVSTRAAVAPAFEQAKAAVASDAAAPAALKGVATRSTLDGLLDPGGHYKQLRDSMRVARKDGAVELELTVPEPTVRRVREDTGLFTSLVLAGVAAGAVVPSLGKYRCRARQGEASATLKQLRLAVETYRASHDDVPRSFEGLGFTPPAKSTYTYCIGRTCLGCTAPGCRSFDEAEGPCRFASAEEGLADNALCAIGDPDDDEDADRWIDDGQDLSNVDDDCE